MCLISKDKEKHIADKPIKCYKCLTEKMQSPCYNLKYEFGSTIKSKFTIKRYKECIKVEQGLHTFKTLNRAIKNSIENKFYWFNVITNEYVMTPIIIECVIPENSTYYIGNNGDLASDKLIIQKVVYDKKPEPLIIKPVQTPIVETTKKEVKKETKVEEKKSVKIEPVKIEKKVEKKSVKIEPKKKEVKKETKVEEKKVEKKKEKKKEEVKTLKPKTEKVKVEEKKVEKKKTKKEKEEVKVEVVEKPKDKKPRKKKVDKMMDKNDDVVESLW